MKAKSPQQPKRPAIGEWQNKAWSLHAKNASLAVKKESVYNDLKGDALSVTENLKLQISVACSLPPPPFSEW